MLKFFLTAAGIATAALLSAENIMDFKILPGMRRITWRESAFGNFKIRGNRPAIVRGGLSHLELSVAKKNDADLMPVELKRFDWNKNSFTLSLLVNLSGRQGRFRISTGEPGYQFEFKLNDGAYTPVLNVFTVKNQKENIFTEAHRWNLPQGKWHFITFTVDRAEESAAIHINGRLAGAISMKGKFPNHAPFSFFKLSLPQSTENFTVRLGRVSFENKVLSEQEIKALTQESLAPLPESERELTPGVLEK